MCGLVVKATYIYYCRDWKLSGMMCMDRLQCTLASDFCSVKFYNLSIQPVFPFIY